MALYQTVSKYKHVIYIQLSTYRHQHFQNKFFLTSQNIEM